MKNTQLRNINFLQDRNLESLPYSILPSFHADPISELSENSLKVSLYFAILFPKLKQCPKYREVTQKKWQAGY